MLSDCGAFDSADVWAVAAARDADLSGGARAAAAAAAKDAVAAGAGSGPGAALGRHRIASIQRDGFYVKVPECTVLVAELDRSDEDALALLQDPSGTIGGCIHRQVMEEWRGDITVGAVLLLRRTSVFTPRIGQHFLNVTPDNVVRVWSVEPAPAPGPAAGSPRPQTAPARATLPAGPDEAASAGRRGDDEDSLLRASVDDSSDEEF
jgi:hypothetical protein